MQVGDADIENRLSIQARVEYGWEQVKEIVGRVWPYVVAGIAVGGAIHGYVPQDFMVGVMGKNAWWIVPVAVVLGIPMYAGSTSIIPVIQALMALGDVQKGITPSGGVWGVPRTIETF